MTVNTFDAGDMRAALLFAARRFEQEEAVLNALDAAVGDGDHGISMRLGFQALEDAITALPESGSIAEVLQESGKSFMGITGGAIGVIFGRMLMAGGKAMTGVDQLGPPELRTMLRAMEEGVAKAGKARPGDRTLLDPLHAACESLASLPSDADLLMTICRAADAAEASARDTANMPCRIGRASRLGDRAIGHCDPGAVSLSLFLRVLAEWMQTENAAVSA